MEELNQEQWAIDAKGLVKVFGKNRAVDGVDLKVKKGTIYGVLGPNGAGKTTTIRMLTTLLKPDGGSAEVLGYNIIDDANQVRQRISLTGQFASLDEDLSGMENMVMIGRLFGFSRREAKKRGEELLTAFDLFDAAKRQVKNYSGGMRRRLDIAASIIVSPDLLFLDEPTTGLDPRSRNQVWDIIRLLVKAGTTVLLTTQYLDEADELADRIAVIDHGKVIAEGTSGELKASIGSGKLHVRVYDPEVRAHAAQVLEQTIQTKVLLGTDPLVLTAQVSDTKLVSKALLAFEDANINISDFSLGQPSLDEVFLTLTGKPADDQTKEEAAG
ncbi:ABC-2 type transport system ATP-binding protein [Amphibacillus marinus]|uniref:ABC-2 type transport system ATP-binding protein n=1 Tax=Amphibacillus marinus TaxID=872970 RepID=A0A1H8KAK8_9BACI|nr:ATP-binding cassette domain-containing protein [Amphibacillus marinus]SEN90049.1 ABC-2 type transport system ATP-binding protein [Amphibacillus marinus]